MLNTKNQLRLEYLGKKGYSRLLPDRKGRAPERPPVGGEVFSVERRPGNASKKAGRRLLGLPQKGPKKTLDSEKKPGAATATNRSWIEDKVVSGNSAVLTVTTESVQVPSSSESGKGKRGGLAGRQTRSDKKKLGSSELRLKFSIGKRGNGHRGREKIWLRGRALLTCCGRTVLLDWTRGPKESWQIPAT